MFAVILPDFVSAYKTSSKFEHDMCADYFSFHHLLWARSIGNPCPLLEYSLTFGFLLF